MDEAPSTAAGTPSGTDGAPRRRRPALHRYRHPVDEAMLERGPLGQRVADRVTNFLGSWMTEVLRHVQAVEHQILELERQILQLEQSILIGISARPAEPRSQVE